MLFVREYWTKKCLYIRQPLLSLIFISYKIINFSLDCLKPAFKPLSNRKLGCEIISETLKQASERLNSQIVRDILDISGINVRSLVKSCPNGLDTLKRAQLE